MAEIAGRLRRQNKLVSKIFGVVCPPLCGCCTNSALCRVQATDRYGRRVGEVCLPDGRSLNQELVRAGRAWWYRQYTPGDTTLERLEAEARPAKRGLWSAPQAVPPWTFRKARQ
jgi:endonuclease YncB( thermonuclease family)